MFPFLSLNRSDERKRHAKVHQKVKGSNMLGAGVSSGSSSRKLPISLALSSKTNSSSGPIKIHRQNSKASTSHNEDLNNNNNTNHTNSSSFTNIENNGYQSADYTEYGGYPGIQSDTKSFLAQLMGGHGAHMNNKTTNGNSGNHASHNQGNNNNYSNNQSLLQDYNNQQQMQHNGTSAANGINPIYWQNNFMDLQPHFLNHQLHNLNSKH